MRRQIETYTRYSETDDDEQNRVLGVSWFFEKYFRRGPAFLKISLKGTL